MSGPLHDCRVIELGGIGPAPFAGMILADLGADVLRLDRIGDRRPPAPTNLTRRGKSSVALDLKHPDGRALLLDLVERADVLIEGFRPGVVERLGIGPDDCAARNPRLVYGRMTGFGQSGPLAQVAGHDINYIAMSGALSLIGRGGQPPVPPRNLLGDFGGGGMFLVAGVLAALIERATSGRGQVVDSSMVDGSAVLAGIFFGKHAEGRLGPRGTNQSDGGSWFYDAFETADGKYVSFGALEDEFFELMLTITGLADDVDGMGPVLDRSDESTWPEMRKRMTALMLTKTRAEWCELLEGTDACFAPVLDVAEAPQHPHNVARATFVEVAGVVQPAPSPRFDRTPTSTPRAPSEPAAHDTDRNLLAWGIAADRARELRDARAIA